MSDYLKRKYDIALSDFQCEQIAKLFLFCHSFKVETTSFGSRWLRCKLPLPMGMKTVADIYKAFLSARLLCVQDDVLKLDVDAWDEDGLIFEQQAHENIISWMNGFVKDYESNITNHKEFFNGIFGVKQIITYGHSMA